jgi:chromosome segregation ATPase
MSMPRPPKKKRVPLKEQVALLSKALNECREDLLKKSGKVEDLEKRLASKTESYKILKAQEQNLSGLRQKIFESETELTHEREIRVGLLEALRERDKELLQLKCTVLSLSQSLGQAKTVQTQFLRRLLRESRYPGRL